MDILIFHHSSSQHLSLNYEIVPLKIYWRWLAGWKEDKKSHHAVSAVAAVTAVPVVAAVVAVAAVDAVNAVDAVAAVVVPPSSHQWPNNNVKIEGLIASLQGFIRRRI